MPLDGSDEFRTISVKFFELNDPHMTDRFPDKTVELKNTEKAIIKGLTVSYFLEGNDIVINDLKEITLENKGTILYITGIQE